MFLFNRSAQAAGPGCEIQATKNQPTSGLGESGSGLRGSKRGPGGVWDGSGGVWEGSWGVPERSGRGLGGVRRGLGGSQDEDKRDKNTKERRQDDPGPPRPEFFPLWWQGRGRFWGPKSIKIAPKKHSNINHFLIAFWIDFGPQNRSKNVPKIDQKSIQNRYQKEARRKHTKV